MAKLDLQPLDLQPIDEAPTAKLDLQPLDLQPIAEEPKKKEPTPEFIDDSKFEELGKKYGVDPTTLKEVAPYYGVQTAPKSLGEATELGAKQVAGTVGRVAFGLPQYIYKKLQDEPTRKALDELKDIGDEQRGLLQSATEMVTAPAGFAGKTGGALARIGEAAGIGGTYGLTESKEGKELEGAAQGAAVGGVLGTAAEGLGLLLNKTGSKLSKAEQEAVDRSKIDLDTATEKVAKESQESENILEDMLRGKKDTLNLEEINQVAEQQLGKETVQEYLDPTSPRGKLIRGELGEGATDDAIIHKLSTDVVDDRVKDFAKYLTDKKFKTSEEALTGIEEHISRQGKEATLNSYKNYVNLNQAQKAIDDLGLVAKDKSGFWSGIVNKVSDNQYTLRHFDDKFGTILEPILNDLNKSRNRLTFARQETRKDLDTIFKKAVSNKVDDEILKSSKIYDSLDTGNYSRLNPQEKEVAQSFKDYFAKGRQFANELVHSRDPNVAPLSIPKIENYVPKVARSVEDQIPLVEKKLEEALRYVNSTTDSQVSNIAQLDKKQLQALVDQGNNPVSDLVKYAKWADNTTNITNGRDLIKELDTKLHTRQGNIALESRARSAMERTGEIPDFILEKNLYKLADKWSFNTYNHLYLRNDLEKLANEAKKIKKLGAENEAEYVATIVQDSLGIRKGTAAEGFLQSRIAASSKLDSLIEKHGATSPQGIILSGVKAIPDTIYGLTRNIYPNLLGYFNSYAALQNLITGFTRLAPELGGTYGYSTTIRGALKTALNFKEYYKLAQKIGNVPADVLRDGEAAIADGLFRSKAFNLSRAGYEALANFGMTFFQKSEEVNRALTIGVADMMAHDISKKSSGALNSLNKFPTTIQRMIQKDPSNVERNSAILAKYLNDTTQFNYNRSSLFEYGRTLGPVLSTFSKWPTAILGEAAYTYRKNGLTKGTLRNMERLLIPYLLLEGADYLIGERSDDKDSLSDRTKKIVGSQGLSGMAPGNALHGFVTGEIFTPPVVDILYKQFITSAAKGETDKIGKGFDAALRNYMPGSGLIRLITDDMVTYTEGRRPEGSGFIERTQEGARKLTK